MRACIRLPGSEKRVHITCPELSPGPATQNCVARTFYTHITCINMFYGMMRSLQNECAHAPRVVQMGPPGAHNIPACSPTHAHTPARCYEHL